MGGDDAPRARTLALVRSGTTPAQPAERVKPGPPVHMRLRRSYRSRHGLAPSSGELDEQLRRLWASLGHRQSPCHALLEGVQQMLHSQESSGGAARGVSEPWRRVRTALGQRCLYHPDASGASHALGRGAVRGAATCMACRLCSCRCSSVGSCRVKRRKVLLSSALNAT